MSCALMSSAMMMSWTGMAGTGEKLVLLTVQEAVVETTSYTSEVVRKLRPSNMCKRDTGRSTSIQGWPCAQLEMPPT